MKRGTAILGVFAIVVIIFGATALGYFVARKFSITLTPNQEEEIDLPIFSSGITPQSVYDRFYENLDVDRGRATSAIVAHHLVVGAEIARIFESIGTGRERQVILIGPNHFNLGTSPAITAAVAWETPYGAVESDARAIRRLVKDVPIAQELAPFDREHSINALTPFVKRSLPDAQIIPVIVHESLSAEDARLLAQALQDIAPNALVIASIDMSHNVPLGVQTFHDDLTQRSLAAGEAKHELEIDSNASLRVLFEINRLRGTQVWQQTYHGSSLASGVAQTWQDNTSHILGYFIKGDATGDEWQSLHVVGDIMLDRGTRRKINEHGIAYPWEFMSRFLLGVDLRIGNLEGTVNEQPSAYTVDPPFRFVFDPSYIEAMKPYIDAVSLANNHAADVGAGAGQTETRSWLDKIGIPWFGAWETPQPPLDIAIRGEKIRIIGYHEFRPDFEELLTLIREAKERDEFVIVIPHWGNEYQHTPSMRQRDMATRMVEAGADLIIGGHPHVVQGVEVINNTPVIYSLGNFVFDQQIPQTWDAVTLGVIKTQDELVLYFLPVGTRDSQPIPYDGADAARVLQIIADASPAQLREQILSSKIIFSYGQEN